MVGGGNISAEGLERQARGAARGASPALVALGRLGYLAEGLVYTLIGGLAVQLALGRGGETTDNTGALTRIAEAPFGRVILIAVAVGIAGYALWRFIQALLDTDDKGTDAKGIVTRLGYAGSGILHVALALSALRLVRTGSAGTSGGESARDWTARLLDRPFGQALVVLAGLVVLGIAGYQFYRAYKAEFREQLETGAMGANVAEWVVRLGRIGYAARGFVFGVIGLFVIVAALRHNPGEARGLDGALAALAAQPAGPLLLGAVALGLVAYGLFLFAQARYRRMVIGA